MSSSRLNFFVLATILLLLFGGGRLQNFTQDPISFLLMLLAILIALVIHEFAHAYAADRLGDPNPRLAGRVSLNPLKHLDPIGTMLIVVAGFGWGKPVAFDPYNLKNPSRDGAIIAAAGPASNLIVSVLAALLLAILPSTWIIATPWLASFLVTLMSINSALAFFNLLPFYPLDGHHLVRACLSTRQRAAYDIFNRQLGYMITLVILFIPFGDRTISNYLLPPVLEGWYSILATLFSFF